MAKTSKKTKTKKTKKTNVVNKDNELLNNKDYKNAEKLFKKALYKESYEIYLSLLEIYPKNKKIYKRLIETLTENYTYKENKKEFKKLFNEYVTNYKILATKREVTILENKLLEYDKVKAKGKSKFLLIAFLGIFGVHKFIEKNYFMGFLYLFSFGLFGIGIIVDLINDYKTYENEFSLNILRYIICALILLLAFTRRSLDNYIYIVLAALILTPLVYSKILKFLPHFIKIIGVLVLLYFGFKEQPILITLPNKLIGTWTTENENTNIKELNIKDNKTTISFTDRKDTTGTNQYDATNNILRVFVDNDTYYVFTIDKEYKEICRSNESKVCMISFTKSK